MILTSNHGFAEWGDLSKGPGIATAPLDRLLCHAVAVQIKGFNYRLRQHEELVPDQTHFGPPENDAVDHQRHSPIHSAV
jgi:hypothetical protein